MTPPQYATGWGHKEVVKGLLDRGADPCTEDVLGHTPVSKAQTADIKEMLNDAKKRDY